MNYVVAERDIAVNMLFCAWNPDAMKCAATGIKAQIIVLRLESRCNEEFCDWNPGAVNCCAPGIQMQ